MVPPPPRRNLRPVTPRNGMGPVEVLWDGDGASPPRPHVDRQTDACENITPVVLHTRGVVIQYDSPSPNSRKEQAQRRVRLPTPILTKVCSHVKCAFPLNVVPVVVQTQTQRIVGHNFSVRLFHPL